MRFSNIRGRKGFEMVLALGEQDRRASFGERAPYVVQDETVAVLVGCPFGVERLDAIDGHRAIATEGGLSNDQPMVEWPARRRTSRGR